MNSQFIESTSCFAIVTAIDGHLPRACGTIASFITNQIQCEPKIFLLRVAANCDVFMYHLFKFCRIHNIMTSSAGSIIVAIIAAIIIIAILVFLVNVLAPIIVGIIIVLIIIGVAYWIYQQARTRA